jgi:hypothetical protein
MWNFLSMMLALVCLLGGVAFLTVAIASRNE